VRAASQVHACSLPDAALLLAYRERGAFTDCFCATLDAPVSLPELIQAFYTTPLFKLERVVLAMLAGAPSSDEDARKLAWDLNNKFAMWTVEAREAHQVLLAEKSGATRSWLMVENGPPASASRGRRVYFGSAVVPRRSATKGSPRMGFVFSVLLPLHTLYSKALLRAACRKLATRRPTA
jgi:hypothetical protein